MPSRNVGLNGHGSPGGKGRIAGLLAEQLRKAAKAKNASKGQSANGCDEQLPLCKSDLDNLRESGLTDQTIRENQLRTEHDSARLSRILNRGEEAYCCLGGLVFPYRNLDGELDGFARVRPHVPRKKGGKPVKYELPVGEPPRAYYPFSSLAKLRDGRSPVFITEGEKKALALSQLGLAAVGIGGIWCGCKKDTEELINDLAVIPWKGRTACLVFDWDPKESTRQNAQAAKRRLTRPLRKAGVGPVLDVQLPAGPDGAKQGADDFIVAHGPGAFRQLVKEARPVAEYHPLTKPQGRTDASNAARLAGRFGEVVVWVGPWDKWLIWDGSRWQVDQALAIEKMAKEIAADMWLELGKALKESQE